MLRDFLRSSIKRIIISLYCWRVLSMDVTAKLFRVFDLVEA